MASDELYESDNNDNYTPRCHFNDSFVVKAELASCRLDFPSAFVSDLCMLSGQAKTVHILLPRVVNFPEI